MTTEQPDIFRDIYDAQTPPMVCKCWLGNGFLMCDSPGICAPVLEAIEIEDRTCSS